MPRPRTVTPACPGRDELSAFDRGLLGLERLDEIAEHLSQCPACASSVEALQQADTVQQRLRTPVGPSAEEAAWARLAERARAVPHEESTGPTVTDSGSPAVVEAPALPAVFGPYVLLEEIGRGGMGLVYKARQEKLNRLVALKLVRAGAYAGREERARFQREGEAVARVRHPHVVQVHDFGEHQGQPYFSMELLEGGTLADRLRRGPTDPREAAALAATLARAVAEAHRQDVVHRDLKPGNVLFTADGTPKVTDFGLAKMLDADSTLITIDNAILGTPAYMAPEQARGDSRDIGRAVDVYALGAILYEALTGRPPFVAPSRSRTLELVRTAEPEPPSLHRRGLARDLEAICLKCLEKEPARRYATATELADDLERWLRGEPTKARPPGRLARLGRVVRRRPRTAAALLLLAVLGLTGSLAWVRMDPDRRRHGIESRLKSGQRVELIGEKGKPAWYSVPIGEGQTQTSEGADGTFNVHSWASALVELVRDPPRQSYRLRAEIRHQQSDKGGRVGLYALHRSFATSQGTAHSLLSWTYDDCHDRRSEHELAKARHFQRTGKWLKGGPRHGAIASLGHNLFLNKQKENIWELGDSQRACGIALGSHGFEPTAETGKQCWRQLAIEVTPGGIRAFWDGRPVAEVTTDEWTAKWQASLGNYHGRVAESPFRDEMVDFVSHGGLGLFVRDSSVSFRRVVVEPLEGE